MYYRKPSKNGNYLTTYNNYTQNNSFELKPYSEGSFYDDELSKTKSDFFSCMDTYASQKIELEDFDNETDYRINEINYYYNNEKDDITRQFLTKKKQIINNYTNSIGKYNFCTYLQRDNKTKELRNKLDSGHTAFLDALEKRRKYAIQTYRNQRRAEYNKLLDNHESYWKKGGYLLTDR